MNNKKAKKLRRLSNLVGKGRSQQEIETIYRNMKSAYKETKSKAL